MLFALSESLAIGALLGLRDLELRIPEDLSFAAFDDFPLASHWSPALTVIRQDIAGLARAAADLLFKRIQAPHDSFAPIRIKASIEWRSSVIANGTAASPKGPTPVRIEMESSGVHQPPRLES